MVHRNKIIPTSDECMTSTEIRTSVFMHIILLVLICMYLFIFIYI